MKEHKGLIGLALLAALSMTTACGGNGDNAAEPSGDVETSADDTASPPAPDDVETIDGTIYANFTGDAAAGEAVFARCRACHSVEAGVNRTGPSLYNIVGGESGSAEGFNYTDANATIGIVWTPEKLFQYLESPRRVIPGTRMAFAGLPAAQDRADLIAFLQTHSE